MGGASKASHCSNISWFDSNIGQNSICLWGPFIPTLIGVERIYFAMKGQIKGDFFKSYWCHVFDIPLNKVHYKKGLENKKHKGNEQKRKCERNNPNQQTESQLGECFQICHQFWFFNFELCRLFGLLNPNVCRFKNPLPHNLCIRCCSHTKSLIFSILHIPYNASVSSPMWYLVSCLCHQCKLILTVTPTI